ncbi:hypothetical protein K458DRAFT_414482 [Lentithecium fluviatile CBS 122367]|uniref:Uncharacterized protein n=1 Tax=Lentithecium fluviatile CBS 122367 TaxID=1168545 RepID=A0A6G1JEW9_9PLEO|nr:hypothetical protein K458DRAFT_414482 [Lentithecium fluviatile CBS 122367]
MRPKSKLPRSPHRNGSRAKAPPSQCALHPHETQTPPHLAPHRASVSPPSAAVL